MSANSRREADTSRLVHPHDLHGFIHGTDLQAGPHSPAKNHDIQNRWFWDRIHSPFKQMRFFAGFWPGPIDGPPRPSSLNHHGIGDACLFRSPGQERVSEARKG